MDKLPMRPTHQAIANLGNEVQNTKKLMIGGLFLIVAFSCATFGLTLGAAEYAKDTTTNGPALVNKATNSPVVTDHSSRLVEFNFE